MSRKDDNRRLSYPRSPGNYGLKTFKEDIFKFLQDFKVEHVTALDKLTNEVTVLKGIFNETKNEQETKANNNNIRYAELEFEPLEEHRRAKKGKAQQEQSHYQVPQSNVPSPSGEELQRKVEALEKENEICNKRIDVMQNQLNFFQQKLEELHMKQIIPNDKQLQAEFITDICRKICFENYRDINHTLMAFWEGNAQFLLSLFLCGKISF